MEDLPKGLANSGAKEIKNRLAKISGGKVLDVATESGDFINTLMKTLKDYDSFVGIDISAKELESAIKEFKDKPVKFIEMNDILKLSLRNMKPSRAIFPVFY